jgi:xylose isomerase
MRTYLILRERARRWNADPDIRALLSETGANGSGHPPGALELSAYSPRHRDLLLGTVFDRVGLAKRGLAYEHLDQLTIDVLLGVR